MAYSGRIPLVTPGIAREPGIRLLEIDFLAYRSNLVNTFDAIRASNVLNESLFGEAAIRKALSYLPNYLREGGLFLASRNPEEEPDVENGTVWEKRGGGFAALEDFGTGSELKKWVGGRES